MPNNKKRTKEVITVTGVAPVSHSIMVPTTRKRKGKGARLPARTIDTLIHHGAQHDEETKAILAEIYTGKDLFHAALINSMLDRTLVHPLPSIYMPGYQSSNTGQGNVGTAAFSDIKDYWWNKDAMKRTTGGAYYAPPNGFNGSNNFRYIIVGNTINPSGCWTEEKSSSVC